jgi:hypothetical protein
MFKKNLSSSISNESGADYLNSKSWITNFKRTGAAYSNWRILDQLQQRIHSCRDGWG